MTYIVGHVAPDWDCIAALWMLQRFGPFGDAEIKLVNTGTPDPAVLEGAGAVVDTGRQLDPQAWRFDHHQLPGAEANETCAAQQVYFRLIFYRNEIDLGYLQPLIDLVFAGDTGKPEAAQSRQIGIHALLSAWKAARWPDEILITWGYEVLDDLAAHLLRAYEARQTLDAHTVYRSADGLLIALDKAPQGATQAAFEAGALLVVWHNPMEATVAVGLNRAPESGIHCGELAAMVGVAQPLGSPIETELRSWYKHPSGFFAGRGTPKAPDDRPLAVPVANLAAALDTAWGR